MLRWFLDGLATVMSLLALALLLCWVAGWNPAGRATQFQSPMFGARLDVFFGRTRISWDRPRPFSTLSAADQAIVGKHGNVTRRLSEIPFLHFGESLVVPLGASASPVIRYGHYLLVPNIVLLTLLAPLPVSRFRAALIRRRVRRRLLAHLCGSCGYDLQATPDRCPECGSPAPPRGLAGVTT